MTPLTGRSPPPEVIPTGRYEWERLIRRAQMPGRLKLCALVLATYADPDGSRVRPGQDALAAVLGVTARTVRRTLADLRGLGLVERIGRGGGRGHEGRTSTYRLVIPTDLLDRVLMLDPGERPADSPDIQMSPQSDHSPDIQVSSDYDWNPPENSYSPDTQMSPQSSPDPPEPPDTQMSGQSAPPEPKNGLADRLRGHLASIEGTSGCPTTTHRPSHQLQKPGALDPTQLTTARGANEPKSSPAASPKPNAADHPEMS